MKNVSIFFGAILLPFVVFSQKVQDDDLSYQYIQLPSDVVKGSKTYQSKIEIDYENEVSAILDDWNRKKQSEQQKFKTDSLIWLDEDKKAETKYQKDVADWEKKGTGQKIVEQTLLAESKPKRFHPPKPYHTVIPEPLTKTMFDKNTLAERQLVLAGFTKVKTGATLVYTVIIHGFEYGDKVKTSTTKVKVVDNKTTTVPEHLYMYKYRFPMSIKVSDASGNVVYTERIAKSDEYVNALTDEIPKDYVMSDVEWDRLQKKIEQEIIVKKMEEANLVVNNKYGFLPVKVSSELFFVKNKDGKYNDLDKATLIAKRGYAEIISNKQSSKTNLEEARVIWNKALTESNLANKDARINESITIALLFNLIEADINIAQFSEATLLLERLQKLDISRSEKKKAIELSDLLYDVQKRIAVNK